MMLMNEQKVYFYVHKNEKYRIDLLQQKSM